MLNRLTDNYNKDINSNVGKLFKIVEDEINEIKEFFLNIKKARNIDEATGYILNLAGKNVNQLRLNENDDLYRQLIKTKMIANLSKGDIETLNEVASVLIGEGFKGIQETWNLPEYNEPAGLVVKMRNNIIGLPFDVIDRVAAGGIDVKWILELKQPVEDIFIGCFFTSGEEITVYPWSPKNVTSRGKVNVAMGNNAGFEGITVYPKKEV